MKECIFEQVNSWIEDYLDYGKDEEFIDKINSLSIEDKENIADDIANNEYLYDTINQMISITIDEYQK